MQINEAWILMDDQEIRCIYNKFLQFLSQYYVSKTVTVTNTLFNFVVIK